MHAALESPTDRAARHPVGATRIRSATELPLAGAAPTCAAVTVLLVIVSLALADGLLGSSVAYERDTTVFYYPLMAWAADQLRHGIFPLWTPQVFGGYPIFADGETGLAYPPVLLALLTLPPDRAFIALRLVHFWIAALGAFALVRGWGLSRSSAVLAGVVFTLGSFLQAQIHHENIIRTAAWLPLLLAVVERALRAETPRTRVRWAVVAALVLGLAGLSLHSQMLAIDLLALGVYGLMRVAVGPLGDGAMAWRARLRVVVAVCAPVVLLALLVAAVQLVPLVELAGFSPRGSGIPYSESAAYSLTVPGLAQLIFPFVFRGPGGLQWGLWTHWESYLYIGLAPLVLVLVAVLCVRSREVLAWGVIGALGLILALGQYSTINLHYYLWLIPGLSGLRAPGRFTIIVVLACAMLSAYGLTWLETEARRLRWPAHDRRLRIASIVLTAGLIDLLVLSQVVHLAVLTWPDQTQAAIQSAYLSLPRDTYALTVSDVYAGLVWATDLANPHVLGAFLGLTCLLASLAVWQLAPSARVRTWPGWSALMIAATACDLLLFGWGIHPRAPLARLATEPAAVQAIEAMPNGDVVPPRLLASPVLSQVAADRLAPFDVQEANGYSSLQFVWHMDYLARVLYVDDVLLDLWNARYVLDPAHYGLVSHYRGVDFLAQQAQLHGPAGSAISEATFAVRPGSTVSELRLVTAMMGSVDVAQDTPVADVELRDSSGQVVASRQLLAGRDAMEWAADLPTIRPHLQHRPVESAGVAFEGGSGSTQRQLAFADLVLDAPVQAASLTVRVVQPKGELALYGGAVIGSDGSSQQLLGRSKAKYREVYADSDIRVLENTAAQPRAFLVAGARTAPSLGSALGQMVHQPFDPRGEVILAADSGANASPQVTALENSPAAAAGNVQIQSYGPNSVRMHASAQRDGLLVLTDTYYPGWQAFVDGQPQPVLRGDVLFRVVPVTAGEHEVELRFQPISVQVGALVTLLSVAIAVGALVLAGKLRTPGRTTK